MVPRLTFRFELLVPTLFLVSFGCAPERPPAEGTGETSQSAAALLPSDDDGETSGTTAKIKVCDANTSRECLHYYVDQTGHTHCLAQQQFCRADGFGWLACGAPAQAPLPEAPDAGAPVEDVSPEPADVH
jgi:hypothetical protein